MRETISPLNQVLDYVERQADWWPVAASGLTGYGIISAVTGYWWGWVLMGAGLAMAALRPAGTSARRRLLLRQARRMVAARRARQAQP